MGPSVFNKLSCGEIATQHVPMFIRQFNMTPLHFLRSPPSSFTFSPTELNREIDRKKSQSASVFPPPLLPQVFFERIQQKTREASPHTHSSSALLFHPLTSFLSHNSQSVIFSRFCKWMQETHIDKLVVLLRYTHVHTHARLKCARWEDFNRRQLICSQWAAKLGELESKLNTFQKTLDGHYCSLFSVTPVTFAWMKKTTVRWPL